MTYNVQNDAFHWQKKISLGRFGRHTFFVYKQYNPIQSNCVNQSSINWKFWKTKSPSSCFQKKGFSRISKTNIQSKHFRKLSKKRFIWNFHTKCLFTFTYFPMFNFLIHTHTHTHTNRNRQQKPFLNDMMIANSHSLFMSLYIPNYYISI